MSKTTQDAPAVDAVGARVDRGVGRPVPERYTRAWFVAASLEAKATMQAIDAAVGIPGFTRMVAATGRRLKTEKD